MVEALRDEHQGGPVRPLGRTEELGQVGARVEVEERHVREHRCVGERVDHGVGERRRHLARADPVPLHLAVERPSVLDERRVQRRAQAVPVLGPHRDAAQREHAVVPDPAALVEEQEAHPRGDTSAASAVRAPAVKHPLRVCCDRVNRLTSGRA